MKIGIVMPCLHYFKGAIESLESARSQNHLQSYIAPNWREKKPLSVTWNEQIKRARADDCDYILVINDDILFAPGTIDEMVRMLEVNRPLDEVIMTAGLNLRSEMADNPYAILGFEPDWERQVNEATDFSCFMVVPHILDLVGEFDENIRPAYFEDNDYHYRMKLLGYKSVVSNHAPYYHFGSQTQNLDPNNPVVPGHVFEGIRNYYIEKWGGNPGHEQFVHPYADESLTPTEWRKVNV